LVILRTFLALAAGFATIGILVFLFQALLQRLTPAWSAAESPSAGSRFVHLGWSFLASAAGGYVTAVTAAANPLVHVLVLGIVVLAVSALSAMQSKGKLPVAYSLVLVAISPLGVLAGGLLRLRVLGIL
jgi:hypothetical protein